MIKQKAEELWITNISRVQNISIGDLALTLGCGQSVNLLAKKKNGQPRFALTRKQIDQSITSGSIAAKSHVIKVRQVAPVIFNNRIDVAQLAARKDTRLKRKPTEIEVLEFPDLDIDEGSLEEYAAENADMDFEDRRPALAVDPKYKKPTVDDE
jgi:hypothetical protein